jgi:hypothetical protein
MAQNVGPGEAQVFFQIGVPKAQSDKSFSRLGFLGHRATPRSTNSEKHLVASKQGKPGDVLSRALAQGMLGLWRMAQSMGPGFSRLGFLGHRATPGSANSETHVVAWKQGSLEM